jgi:hypothetical protein
LERGPAIGRLIVAGAVTRRLGLVFPDAFTTTIPRRAALSKSLVFSEILGPHPHLIDIYPLVLI